jgi:glycosyltransferase involved in cell wall biosynthesis
MSKKIIHLIDTLNVGGVEKSVVSLAVALKKKKFNVEVWCLVAGGFLEEELKMNDVSIEFLNIKNCYSPIAILQLSKKLKSQEVDVIHTHGYFASTVGRLAALYARTPQIIGHIHTIFNNLNHFNVFIDNWLNKKSSNVVFIANSIRQTFLDAGYKDHGNTVILYNGVEDHFFRTDGKINKKIIVNVASLTEHKNQELLVRAFCEINGEDKDLQLWIAGEGPKKESIIQLIKELKAENDIKMLGLHEDIPELLSEVDIFALTSKREGCPLALLEAMGAGLAIIAPNIGGISEMIQDKEEGFLIAAEDKEALKTCLLKLVKDDELCATIGKNARQRFLKDFTQTETINKLLGIYN